MAFDYPYLNKAHESFAEGRIYESRSLPTFWPDYPVPAFRKIANLAPKRGRYRPVGLLPHGIVLHEYIHWSCLYRWRKYHDSPKPERYAPPNLELAMAAVQHSYFPSDAAAHHGPLLYVVGKHGEILRPDHEREAEQVYRWFAGESLDD